jgi:hypothetical protein
MRDCHARSSSSRVGPDARRITYATGLLILAIAYAGLGPLTLVSSSEEARTDSS